MPRHDYNVANQGRSDPGARRNLTDIERRGIYQQLLERTENGVLPCTAYREVARRFGCNPRTVKRVWLCGQASIAAGSPAGNVRSQIRGLTFESR